MKEEQFYQNIGRICRNDREGLREIYEDYCPMIYSVIAEIVLNREDAEDVTSDFFIRLWESADTENHGGTDIPGNCRYFKETSGNSGLVLSEGNKKVKGGAAVIDEKQFEQEYRAWKRQDAPQLWERIEPRLRDHAGTQKNRYIRYGISAAAVVVARQEGANDYFYDRMLLRSVV